MKKCLLLVCFLLPVLACNKPATPHQYAMENTSVKVDKSRLYADVKFLTQVSPPRQAFNLPSLDKSAAYIRAEFEKISDRVSYQPFPVDGREYKNVICSLGPDTGARIIIGAHYDVCGDQPGADDNASGVAGLLEIGRLIRELQPALKYRVDLVAYTLEEPPHFKTAAMGSAVHARSLATAGVAVRAMIALEMIGYYSEEKNSQRYPVAAMHAIYPDRANFISVVGNMDQGKLVGEMQEKMRAGSQIDVQSLTAPAAVPGVDFSDHLNYWKYKFPAVMITNTAFFRNPHYHLPSDTIETLDFDKMAEVVRGTYWAVVHLD
jgi:Peptidase family M28